MEQDLQHWALKYLFANSLKNHQFTFLNCYFLIARMSAAKKELPDDFFDPNKLSESSINKYQSYFKIDCPPEQLKERIKAHFYNEFKVQTNVVLERFLKLKRDQKEVKYRSCRTRNKNT